MAIKLFPDLETQIRIAEAIENLNTSSGGDLTQIQLEIANIKADYVTKLALDLQLLEKQGIRPNGSDLLVIDGKINSVYIDSLYTTDIEVVETVADMLALPDMKRGDLVVVTNTETTYILKQEPSNNIDNWVQFLNKPDVVSVNGKTGAVVLGISDIDSLQASLNNKLNVSDIYLDTDKITIGNNASAEGANSTAIGVDSHAEGNLSIALGYDVTAGGFATVIGNRASASGNQSVALGNQSSATSMLSTALGSSSSVSGNQSIAIGNMTSVTEMNSVALGSAASAISMFSTALGHGATANGQYASTLGFNSSASDFSTALGSTSSASGEGSITIGFGAKAEGVNSIAIGRGTKVTEDNVADFGSDRQVRVNETPENDRDATSKKYVDDKTTIKEQNNNTDIKFWTGSQTAYDSISEKDTNTLYFIEEE